MGYRMIISLKKFTSILLVHDQSALGSGCGGNRPVCIQQQNPIGVLFPRGDAVIHELVAGDQITHATVAGSTRFQAEDGEAAVLSRVESGTEIQGQCTGREIQSQIGDLGRIGPSRGISEAGDRHRGVEIGLVAMHINAQHLVVVDLLGIDGCVG